MASTTFQPNAAASQVISKLWDADKNRLKPGVDYDIDLQGYTKVYKREDRARDPLFNWVHEDVFKRPTYKAFIALLDNYETETGIAEEVTAQELAENRRFIDVIMETDVMKITHKFLASKGKSPKDVLQFKHQLYQIWFELYSRTRGVKGDSSGFEHVFVGEVRRAKDKGSREVIGFHNWIQFYLQEKRGAVDYQGYVKARGARGTPDDDTQLVTIQFTWKDGVKPVGSSFIGTSPEFEMALYTICFLMNSKSDTDLRIHGMDVTVQTHRYTWNNRGVSRNYIGSSFPKAQN